MQNRALVKERARRNLLLLVDGVRTEAMLLQQVAGVTSIDLAELESLGLIEEGSRPRPRERAPDSLPPTEPMDLPLEPMPAAAPAPAGPEDYAGFTAALSKMISSELGLRGFTLVLAVEKASTPQELLDVAERVIGAIRDRKGEAAAAAARTTLFGG